MVSGGLVKGAAKGGDVAVKGGGVCNGGPPDEGAIAKQPYGRGGGGRGGGGGRRPRRCPCPPPPRAQVWASAYPWHQDKGMASPGQRLGDAMRREDGDGRWRAPGSSALRL